MFLKDRVYQKIISETVTRMKEDGIDVDVDTVDSLVRMYYEKVGECLQEDDIGIYVDKLGRFHVKKYVDGE